MKTRSELHLEDGILEERATICHNGREFMNGGAFVEKDFAVGYVRRNDDGSFTLTTWGGVPLADLRVTGMWETRINRVRNRLISFSATINGLHMTGKNSGEGMVLRLRARGKKTS